MNERLRDALADHLEFCVDIEDYEVIKEIGRGAFGNVYLAKEKKSGRFCAIKQMHEAELKKTRVKLYVREIETLLACDSPFLMKLYGFTVSDPYALVCEYVPNKSLFDYVHTKRKLAGTQKTQIALGIAMGMVYLHSNNIIHRDLKAENILLTDDFVPKICDFGIARFSEDDSLLTQKIGTPNFMAPEVYMTKNYTHKIDQYSYAMILYEMITGSLPFLGKNQLQINQMICVEGRRPPIPSSCPDGLKKLVKDCWSQDPSKRPEFSEIVELFRNGTVFFPGTDIEAVNMFTADSNELKSMLGSIPGNEEAFVKTEAFARAPEYAEKYPEDFLSMCYLLTDYLTDDYYNALVKLIPNYPKQVMMVGLPNLSEYFIDSPVCLKILYNRFKDAKYYEKFLESSNPDVIELCYSIMEVPIEYITKHLGTKELRQPALNYLLVHPDQVDSRVLDCLIDIEEETTGLILAQCDDSLLTENKRWLTKRYPTEKQTLTILIHTISNTPSGFYNNPDIPSILKFSDQFEYEVKVVIRTKLTSSLRDSNKIGPLVRAAIKKSKTKSIIPIISACAKQFYDPSYNRIIPYLSSNAKNSKKLLRILSTYKGCNQTILKLPKSAIDKTIQTNLKIFN